jgi:hypothetical protein
MNGVEEKKDYVVVVVWWWSENNTMYVLHFTRGKEMAKKKSVVK